MAAASAQAVAVPAALAQRAEGRVRTIQDFPGFLQEPGQASTTELLAALLAGALRLRASDVHLEPREQEAALRLRIDGVLQEAGSLPREPASQLVSRLKLVSGVKLNISGRPQDGRFSLTIPQGEEEFEVEVRTSTLPSEHGEALVLRLLNPKDLVDLEELGLREDLLALFRKQIKKPNGMILVTGPTGSGKTTTLYAFLRAIQNPEIKIVTIEDPIEYHLEGVPQTQVAPEKEYTFASGLRAIVRQDPDVILVGEIRDGETAEIALQASLTGHLVFSTLHTNDAAGAVSRLQSLGAELADIGAALNLIIAQRLVRRVCGECATLAAPPPEDLKKLKGGLAELPASLKQGLPKDLRIPRPGQCPACNATGYQGRTGIFEAIALEEAMEEYILQGPSIAQLRKKAQENGMVPMYQDGLLKVVEGVTTIEEVDRVTAE